VDVTITSGAHESRACRRADQDISMVRVLVATSDAGYLAIEARTRQEYEARLPWLERAHVTFGIQNHNGPATGRDWSPERRGQRLCGALFA
jgi:hypothetical protein